jgi:hypothetical protein
MIDYSAGCVRGKLRRAACDTVNVFPPMTIVPSRAPPRFSPTTYVTAPLPLPDAPEVTVIQFAAVVAVHPQPEPEETPIGVPAPPKLEKLALE